MGENLYRLAAEDDRGDAMAAVRGHNDEIATLRPCSIVWYGCSCSTWTVSHPTPAACAASAAAPRVFAACPFMRILY
jgi:hypothetical protein